MFIERPEKLIPLSGVDEIYTMLSLYGVNHSMWGAPDTDTKSVEDLVREVLNHEALIALEYVKQENVNGFLVTRHIHTVTAQVMHDTHTPTLLNPNHITRQVLREYRLIAGKEVPRKHPNSLSEKVKWLERDNLVLALWRALSEELGIIVDGCYLEPPYLYRVPDDARNFPHKQLVGFERDKHPSGSYPGIWTNNQLEHFIWLMPDQYYNPEGYQEVGTNHIFKWESVSSSTVSESND